jgi:dihydrofolate synthase/folylpolyglutamate synthase
MRYKEALEYLYGLQKHGIKLGLDNSRQILHAIGNPEQSFRSVHVAGTNGKGSTTTAIAYIMQAHGHRTGLFTSPHLLSFTERIRVDTEEIGEEKVIELTLHIKSVISGIFPPDFSPTFFEFVTAVAFAYFRENGVRWAAVETGMGGRLDSTNVIEPEAVAITPVSLDHKEFLGGTLREIAREKAGIIKPGRPVVIGPQNEQALDVLIRKAADNDCPVYFYGKDFNSRLKEQRPDGIVFDYQSDLLDIKDIFFPLAGNYQAANAAVAIKAAEAVGFSGEAKIREGLGRVRLPGRLELAGENPEIRLDGGHNPEAARFLAESLKNTFLKGGRRLILVTGIMGDKDIDGILRELLPLASEAIFTAPSYGRAAHPDELDQRARRLGFEGGHVRPKVAEALELAKSLSGASDLILVAGSFYTAGEAKEVLAGDGRLTGLRE